MSYFVLCLGVYTGLYIRKFESSREAVENTVQNARNMRGFLLKNFKKTFKRAAEYTQNKLSEEDTFKDLEKNGLIKNFLNRLDSTDWSWEKNEVIPGLTKNFDSLASLIKGERDQGED